MKFLHTSDWHLGKTFYETSLIEDQKHFLVQILDEIGKDSYDALVVAGDIYDKSIPTPEAVQLFSWFLKEIVSRNPNLKIFLTSGNHDSASRLSFGAELFANQNIFITTNAEKSCDGIVAGSGENSAVIYQIPFVVPGAFYDEDGKSIKHQQELLETACRRIRESHQKNHPDLPAVVSAHIFASASRLGGSERSFVGTAEQVSASLFEGFNYTALGHIHSKQSVSKDTIRYSGAPLPYTFGEGNDKVMLKVTVEKDRTQIEEIPFKLLHKVVRLEGTFASFLENHDHENRNDYVEIICTDSVTHEDPLEILKSNFPNILSFRTKRNSSEHDSSSIERRRQELEQISSGDFGKIFDLFIEETYSSKPDEKKQDLLPREREAFIEIAKEVQEKIEK